MSTSSRKILRQAHDRRESMLVAAQIRSPTSDRIGALVDGQPNHEQWSNCNPRRGHDLGYNHPGLEARSSSRREPARSGNVNPSLPVQGLSYNEYAVVALCCSAIARCSPCVSHAWWSGVAKSRSYDEIISVVEALCGSDYFSLGSHVLSGVRAMTAPAVTFSPERRGPP